MKSDFCPSCLLIPPSAPTLRFHHSFATLLTSHNLNTSTPKFLQCNSGRCNLKSCGEARSRFATARQGDKATRGCRGDIDLFFSRIPVRTSLTLGEPAANLHGTIKIRRSEIRRVWLLRTVFLGRTFARHFRDLYNLARHLSPHLRFVTLPPSLPSHNTL